MKYYKSIFFSVLMLFVSLLVTGQHINIIPQPLSLEKGEGAFKIDADLVIVTDGDNKENAIILQNVLSPVYNITIEESDKNSNAIILKTQSNLLSELGKEGYYLNVDNNAIEIKAATKTGVFYGIQSLRQLLPVELSSKKDALVVPRLKIKDYPRFGWRAFMLDESRYFKGMEVVKDLMDQMALLKMNVFHWHLTDDQGWRIEIKKYPKLTEIGSYRKDSQIGGWNSKKSSGKPHSGFYTQAQIKEIIDYAAERHITIIPEIEMPGHASAAIAAYPWLGTIGKLKVVPTVFGKLPDSYNVTDPKVYEFLENVLTEVMQLFPSKIIHIGGDEVKFDAWKNSEQVQGFMKKNNLKTPADLQIFFTNKISSFIDSKGHRMMGWNEILGVNVHGWQKNADSEATEKLANSAIIHFWKGELNLMTQAVTEGYDIVNSLHSSTYLDYPYRSIPLEKAYEFDPIPKELDKKYHKKVMGLGCQMWGEWIPKVSDMYRQVFPRLAAYAEVGWTDLDRKDFKVFRSNLDDMLLRWKNANIGYAEKFMKNDFD